MIGKFEGADVYVEVSDEERGVSFDIDDIDDLDKGMPMIKMSVLSGAADILHAVATEIVGKTPRPESVEIEAGFNLSANSKLLFVQGGGSATFRIKVCWK